MTQGWALSVKVAKRELLLRAAREEFAELGLEGATMRGIAMRAGCSTGAIYPLFESKEAIYADLLQHSLSALDAHVAAAVQSAPGPEAQVAAGCEAFLGYYLENRFEVNLGLYAFRGVKRQGVGKALDDSLNCTLAQVLERIAEPLGRLQGRETADVRPWIALLFSQMIGALVLQMAGRLKFLDTDARMLLAMMLDQLGVVNSPPREQVLRAPRKAASKSKFQK
jgi:AcrR family transcriptional regulator